MCLICVRMTGNAFGCILRKRKFSNGVQPEAREEILAALFGNLRSLLIRQSVDVYDGGSEPMILRLKTEEGRAQREMEMYRVSAGLWDNS